MMTVHVLHAGDGYTYLTRQVASGDHQRGRSESLTDYYTATGNPPGRWTGSGLDQLGVDGTVTEAQMRALFGRGLHPDADRIRSERTTLYLAAGESPVRAAAAAERDVRLGRKFPTFAPRVEGWRDRLAAAYADEAVRLGLAGPKELTGPDRDRVRTRVGTETFREVHGRDPRTETELRTWIARQAMPARQPVAGYDLVFTPVKSVSVLWALAAPEISRQVEAAHHAAVARALTFVEQHAALTRAGAGGIAQFDTHGLTVALFDHRDSRSGDPNLHTHAAVSTKVRGRDGKWRSLDGRALFAIAVAASETYNTAVEDELRSRLGVTFAARGPVHGSGIPGTGPLREDGLRSVREIVGIDRRLLDRFASRRAAVEADYRSRVAAYRQRWGHEPSRAVQMRLAQEAALATRSGKHPARSLDQLRSGWMAQARTVLGATSDQEVRTAVHAALHTAPDPAGPGPASDLAGRVADQVLTTVADHRATWTVWHLRAEAERRLRALPVPGPADRDRLVEQVTSAALDRSIRLTVPPAETICPDALTRTDGDSMFTVHGGDLFTSTAVLDAEERLVAAGRHPVAAPIESLPADAGAAMGLDAGQVALLEAFATGPRLLVAGIGPAGSGKTTAMRALARAAAGAGVRVIGLAPSARAAQVLGDELEIPAETLHKFLHTAEVDPDRLDLRSGDIVLVDEAGMAGTLRLARLVDLAAERGAVVRLLGDPRQLAAVESGGALRLIEAEVGAVRLDVIHRFADPDEAAATLALRSGREAGLEFYRDRDRIHSGSADAATDAAYAAWRSDVTAGSASVLLARTGEQVRELSARARLDRIADGLVDPTRQVRLHDGTHAGVGDLVLTRRNDRRQVTATGRDWVKNGDLWHVLAVRDDGGLDLVHARHRGRVRLEAPYVEAEVELGYAATIHRAQGITVDVARVLADAGLTRQALYTAVTRGRLANHLYVVTHGMLGLDADRPPEPEQDPIEVLVDILGRDGGERPATHVARDEQAAANSLARLVPEYLHAYALHAEAAYGLKRVAVAVLGHDLGRAVVEDSAWPHLASALAQLAGAGRDARAVLAAAESQRELSSADSAAEVLAWRIAPALRGLTTDARLPLYVPSPPDAADGDPLAEWLRQRAHRIRSRVGALVQQVCISRDSWMDRLGPQPDDPTEREEWTANLAAIVSHRDQYRIVDRINPIGPRPPRPGPEREAWTRLGARLARASHRLADGRPEQGRDTSPRISL